MLGTAGKPASRCRGPAVLALEADFIQPGCAAGSMLCALTSCLHGPVLAIGAKIGLNTLCIRIRNIAMRLGRLNFNLVAEQRQ